MEIPEYCCNSLITSSLKQLFYIQNVKKMTWSYFLLVHLFRYIYQIYFYSIAVYEILECVHKLYLKKKMIVFIIKIYIYTTDSKLTKINAIHHMKIILIILSFYMLHIYMMKIVHTIKTFYILTIYIRKNIITNMTKYCFTKQNFIALAAVAPFH